MIRVEGVSKAYGPVLALDDVSMQVAPGEVVLLLGANGAGKSTLIRCILGVVDYAGAIGVQGLDPLRQGKEVRRRIGYMPQAGGLHDDLTVAETLDFYGALRGLPAAGQDALLEDVGLASAATRRVGELSGGMRQRLGFAVARLGEPPILVLDEPSVSLDRDGCRLLGRRVRELADTGVAVLLSTHAEASLAGMADRRVVLDQGRRLDVAAVRSDATARSARPLGSATTVGSARALGSAEAAGSAGSARALGSAGAGTSSAGTVEERIR